MRPPAAMRLAAETRRRRRRRGRAPRRSRNRLVGSRWFYGGRCDHAQQIDAAPVGANDAELQFTDLNGFAAPRQTSEFLHQQSADGVVFVVGKRRAEVVVEV